MPQLSVKKKRLQTKSGLLIYIYRGEFNFSCPLG